MNINQKMDDLGRMGAEGYQASDDVVNQLLNRTRRVRAVRQGGTALASSVGAAALALVAVQVVSQGADDPAESNTDGVIDNVIDTPVIENYADRYADSWVPPETDVAEPEPEIEVLDPATGSEDQDKPVEEPKPKDDKPKAEEPKKKEPVADTCEEDHPYDKYEYKYYKCAKGKWIPKPGWLQVGDDFYQIISWTDAATGQTRTGAYIGPYDKIVFAHPDNNWGDFTYYLEGQATFSGSTCTGVTKEIYGAPFQYTCLPDQDNGNSKVDNKWVLQDDSYTWDGEKYVQAGEDDGGASEGEGGAAEQ